MLWLHGMQPGPSGVPSSAVISLERVKVGDALPSLTYDVTSTTVVLGALAARDWRPMHHDYHFAVERQGVQDIFLNSPNQGSWLERFVTDWTGPKGRLGRLRFKMRKPIFPGDTMVIEGVVRDVSVDDAGCGWVELDLTIRVGDVTCTESEARVALPTSPDDNPWRRRGDDRVEGLAARPILRQHAGAHAEAGGFQLGFDLQGVFDGLLADGEDSRLLRGEPEREGAGEVLDEDAAEPLHAAERGAVDHHGAVRVIVSADVFQLEPLGQVVVELHGAELPLAADAVAHHEVDLRPVERRLADADGIIETARLRHFE